MKTFLEILQDKTIYEPNTGCLLWTEGPNSPSYGQFMINGKLRNVHRLVYEAHNGEIPSWLQVLHKCDTPRCCEITHLELGTQSDNIRDCSKRNRNSNKNKTHCPRGHEYSVENTFYRKGKSSRFCKKCNRQFSKNYIKKSRGISVESPIEGQNNVVKLAEVLG